MSPETKGFIVLSVLKMLLVFTVVMVGVALLTLMERKVSAWMQNRRGPNRVGWAGLLQPAADGLKNILKEETLPGRASRGLFMLAPAVAFIPALMMSAVIPFAAPLPLTFDLTLPLIGQIRHDGPMPMVVADLPIGFLFVLAMASLGVYGIALAGWSSNSKYSLLGGLRASAQMVSYEVALGLSLIPLLLVAGNVQFSAIIAGQQEGLWYVLPLFVTFFLFLISGFAELNRLPFDLPEAEAELTAGYHTEYSAMKFSMFFIAEYSNMVTVSAMTATLFFGGWDVPFTRWDETPGLAQTLVTGVAFFLKTMFFVFVIMWVRWTLPRFRYDQLMALGWRFMIPLALVYVKLMTLAIWAIERGLTDAGPKLKMGLLFLLNLGVAVVIFRVIDSGRILAGAHQRSATPPVAPAAAEG